MPNAEMLCVMTPPEMFLLCAGHMQILSRSGEQACRTSRSRLLLRLSKRRPRRRSGSECFFRAVPNRHRHSAPTIELTLGGYALHSVWLRIREYLDRSAHL